MWIPYSFWTTFAAVVMISIPLLYVLRAGIKKPGNLPAFLLFLSIFLWSIGEMLERIAGPPRADYPIAYSGANIIAIGVFLTSAVLIHLAVDFPQRVKIKKHLINSFLYGAYVFSIVGIAGTLVDIPLKSETFIKGVFPYTALGQRIWGLKPGIGYIIYMIWLSITALIFLFFMIFKLRMEKMNLLKSQIKILVYGIILAYALIIPTGFVPMLMGIDMFPLTTLAFSIFGAFIFYAIYRYRMFLVTPVIESTAGEEKMPEMGVYPMERDAGYARFAGLAKSGNEALAFISYHPEEFKEKYELRRIPVFEITDKMGKDRLNPGIEEHQEMIPFIINSFVDESRSPVILMDIYPSLSRILGEKRAQDLMRKIWSSVDKTRAVYIVIR